MHTHPIRPPRSRILVEECTRSWARDQVAKGSFPRGSIWFPGTFGRRAELGTLFGPDPDWKALDAEGKAGENH